MKKLTKDKKNGMVFGVCAGLANSTGIDASILRILAIIGTFATGSILLWIYLLLAIILPVKNSNENTI